MIFFFNFYQNNRFQYSFPFISMGNLEKISSFTLQCPPKTVSRLKTLGFLFVLFNSRESFAAKCSAEKNGIMGFFFPGEFVVWKKLIHEFNACFCPIM